MLRIAARTALFAVIALALAVPSVAAEKPGAVMLSPSELKWTDDPRGVKIASVHGDGKVEAAHFFVKLPAGFSVPNHFHTADHWVAVVSGTVILSDGGAEKRLPAGSAFGFTGKKNHTTKCLEGADCILFVDSRGAWDVIAIEDKK